MTLARRRLKEGNKTEVMNEKEGEKADAMDAVPLQNKN